MPAFDGCPITTGPTRTDLRMSTVLLRLLGVLLLLSALAMALFRAPDRPVETLVARWAPAPSEFIEVKGQVVHLRDEGPKGDAEPLVLLHGTSSSLHSFEGWAKALKGQRRVITLDLPAFGLTGPFTGQYPRDDYRGDALAGFVIDVLDQLQVQRFVIGGNSLGGEVAWRVAHLAPQRVSKLILVDASGLAFKPDSVPLGFVIARIPVIRGLSEYFTPKALVAQGIANVYGDPSRVTEEQVERYYELALREGNRRALGLRLTHLQSGEHAERLNGLKLPTLILWGGKDRLIPPANAQVFQQRIAGSQLVVYPELGHVPQEEDPARTVADVKRFLGL
jgi:pimeloyl-ACP methyl ester carboxylesterase